MGAIIRAAGRAVRPSHLAAPALGLLAMGALRLGASQRP